MAEHLVNLMNNTNDPRLGIYAVQQNNEWTGLVSGYPTTETNATNCAYLNKDVLGDYTSPSTYMRYDEVLFIQAEAIQRGWIAGDAAACYQNAIRASINYWKEVDTTGLNITDKVIENFLANVPYDGTLESIINQKYVALFWVGYEAWADYRRTGYPELTIGSGTFNDHILPTRLVYPTNTMETNKENYNAAVERLRTYYGGADDMKTPVWWSKAAVDKGIK